MNNATNRYRDQDIESESTPKENERLKGVIVFRLCTSPRMDQLRIPTDEADNFVTWLSQTDLWNCDLLQELVTNFDELGYDALKPILSQYVKDWLTINENIQQEKMGTRNSLQDNGVLE